MSRHQTDVIDAAACDFSSNTIDKNKVRKCRSALSQEPWKKKSTEINGTFMRYQMTHQIHLAVNTHHKPLSLTLAAFGPTPVTHPVIYSGWDRAGVLTSIFHLASHSSLVLLLM